MPSWFSVAFAEVPVKAKLDPQTITLLRSNDSPSVSVSDVVAVDRLSALASLS